MELGAWERLEKSLGRFFFRRSRELQKARDFIRFLAFSLRVWHERRRAARQYGLGLRTRSIIVFFTPTSRFCNGGVMSIAALAAESRSLNPDAAVVCSLYPDVMRYESCRNTSFPNDEVLISFDWICRRTKPRRVMLHVPEYIAKFFPRMLLERQLRWLKTVPCVHVNVMNQNILLMPSPGDLDELRGLGNRLTQTTAHGRYATQEICDRYGIPLHHLSTYADHTGWPCVRFGQKERVILISPDEGPRRPEVLKMIASRLPDYRVVEIRGIPFAEYLRLVAGSLFTLTLGEGFDGYFMQPPYCGSLGFAVYNDEFFPGRDWLACENIYASYDDLLERFADDVRRFESDGALYENVCARTRTMADGLFGHEAFTDNLRRFYEGKYDFLPGGGVA